MIVVAYHRVTQALLLPTTVGGLIKSLVVDAYGQLGPSTCSVCSRESRIKRLSVMSRPEVEYPIRSASNTIQTGVTVKLRDSSYCRRNEVDA